MFRTLFGSSRFFALAGCKSVFLSRRRRAVTAGRRFARPRLEVLEDRLVPATHVWSGASAGHSENWSDPRNWSSGGSPGGDPSATLVFPDHVSNLNSYNDDPFEDSFSVESIKFLGSGYYISGYPIHAIYGLRIETSNSSGENLLGMGLISPETMPQVPSQTVIDVSLDGTLDMVGTTSTDFVKTGTGTLGLYGSNLHLLDSIFDLEQGTLVVGSDSALGNSYLEIKDGTTLRSGAGPGSTITMANGVAVSGTASISGSQAINFTGPWGLFEGATLIVDNTEGTAISDGYVGFGFLYGTGSLVKRGNGILSLDGANIYEGGTRECRKLKRKSFCDINFRLGRRRA
jgi:autotransporter-associated beta strand protein